MRCIACNARLTEFDATVKYASSGHYVDLCSSCRSTLPKNIALIERQDLARTETENFDSDIPESYVETED